jgi:HEAT repeat protein
MARVRRVLVVGIACGALFLASSSSLWSQSAPGEKPAKLAPPPEPSPLLVEPKTPEEFFASTLLMVDLARLDLARKYLEQFDAGAPDDELLLKIRDKQGTGEFLKLASIKELQPLSSQLLDRLSAAARKQSEDPAFVDGLIARLSGNPSERELAIRELRNAGPRAVPQLLKQMSQPDMADKQDALVIALTRMGRQVVPPLLGGLDAPQERVRSAVIDVLGWLEANEAIPYLWYPAFAEEQPNGVRMAAQGTLAKLMTGSRQRTDRLSSVTASNELRHLAKLLFQKPELLPQENGSVVIWSWDEPLGTVVAKSYSPPIAAMLISSRFARQSLSLSPEQSEPQRQYLASLLGLEVLQNGWDKSRTADPGSAMYLALTAGEETVSQVLADALEAGQPATAVASLDVLGQIGTREQLLGLKGLKSPVLAALNSPDSRTQFAAANAILRIEPQNSFPGANRVVAVLARALTDPGQSRALVIDADRERAGTTAAFLVDAGYEGIVAVTGREGFEKAASTAGIDVIVVHVNCLRWDLTQTLANIRADARTAAIPIVVYGPAATRDQVARLVARSGPATYISESATSDDFIHQYRPFAQGLKTPALSAQERNQQMIAASFWLATLASARGAKVFDITSAEKELSLVAESHDAGPNAIIALGGLGTRPAQQRLAAVALNAQLDASLREAAAAQLGYHIQRFGLLLTKDEVTQVHTAWVEAQIPAIKSALAGVIGTLRPNASLVGERLQQFPAPIGRTP